ncbi:uncharacterized protein LOC105845055 isoform X2 [Hydra vulgaris]|uniref:uncharacterized protein LOC105845055 isoform X2 n=1 Tax=Hydra vulgaris TaxID=6087 RepID=UPI001F5F3913|nr:uncharacterized protein LOC105845055 [Hydra vulgaris]
MLGQHEFFRQKEPDFSKDPGKNKITVATSEANGHTFEVLNSDSLFSHNPRKSNNSIIKVQQYAQHRINYKKTTIETNSLQDTFIEEIKQQVKDYSREQIKFKVKPPKKTGTNTGLLYEQKIYKLERKVDRECLSQSDIEHLVKYTETGLGTKIIDALSIPLIPLKWALNDYSKITSWGNLENKIPLYSMQVLAYAIEKGQCELVMKVHDEIINSLNQRVKLTLGNIPLIDKFIKLLDSPLKNTAAIALGYLVTQNDKFNDAVFIVKNKLRELITLPCTIYGSSIDKNTYQYINYREISFLELRLRAMMSLATMAKNRFELPEELYKLVKETLNKVEENPYFFLPTRYKEVNQHLGQKNHRSIWNRFTNLEEAVNSGELLSEEDFDYLHEQLLISNQKNMKQKVEIKIKVLRIFLKTSVINNQRNNEIHKKFLGIITKHLDEEDEETKKLAFLCLCHFDLEQPLAKDFKLVFLKKGLEKSNDILIVPLSRLRGSNEQTRYQINEQVKKDIEYRDLAIYSLTRFIENNKNISEEFQLYQRFEEVFARIKTAAICTFSDYVYFHALNSPKIEKSLVKNLQDYQTFNNDKLRKAANNAILSIVSNIDRYPELQSLLSLNNLEDLICSKDPQTKCEICYAFAQFAYNKQYITNKALGNLFNAITQLDENNLWLIKAKGYSIQGVAHVIKQFTEQEKQVQDLPLIEVIFIEHLFSYLSNKDYQDQVIFCLLQFSKLFSFNVTPETKIIEESKRNIKSVFERKLGEYTKHPISNLFSSACDSLGYIISTLNNLAKARFTLDYKVTDLVSKSIILKENRNIQSEAIATLGNAAANPQNPGFSDITLENLIRAFSDVDQINQDNIRATLKIYLSIGIETRKLSDSMITKFSWYLHDNHSALNSARFLEIVAENRINNFSDDVLRRIVNTTLNSDNIELKIKLAETLIAFTKHRQLSAEYLKYVEELWSHEELQEYTLKIIINVTALNPEHANELSKEFFEKTLFVFSYNGKVGIKISICKLFAGISNSISYEILQVLLAALDKEPVVKVKHEVVKSLKNYIFHCKKESLSSELLQGLAKAFCIATANNNPIASELDFAKELINTISLLCKKNPDMLSSDLIIKCAILLEKCFDEELRKDAKAILFKVRNERIFNEMVKKTIRVEEKVNTLQIRILSKERVYELIKQVEKEELFTINYVETLSIKAKVRDGAHEEALKGLQKATNSGKIVGINVINNLNELLDLNPKYVAQILSDISIQNGENLPNRVKENVEKNWKDRKDDKVFLNLFIDLLSKHYIPDSSCTNCLLELVTNADCHIAKTAILGLSYISQKHFIGQYLTLENIKLLIRKLADIYYKDVERSIINIISFCPKALLNSEINKEFDKINDLKALEASFSTLKHDENENKTKILQDITKYDGHILNSTFSILQKVLAVEDAENHSNILITLAILKQAAEIKIVFPQSIIQAIFNFVLEDFFREPALSILLELCSYNQEIFELLHRDEDKLDVIKYITQSHSSKEVKAIAAKILQFYLLKKGLERKYSVFEKVYDWESILYLYKNKKESPKSLGKHDKHKKEILFEFWLKKVDKNFNLDLVQRNQLLFFFNIEHVYVQVLALKEKEKNICFDTIVKIWIISRISSQLPSMEIEDNHQTISFLCSFIRQVPRSESNHEKEVTENTPGVQLSSRSVEELKFIDHILTAVSYQKVSAIASFVKLVEKLNLPFATISRMLNYQGDHNKVELSKLHDIIAEINLINIPQRDLDELEKIGWDRKTILFLKVAMSEKTGDGTDTELVKILTSLYNNNIDVTYKHKVLEIIQEEFKGEWIKKLNNFICKKQFENNTSELNTDELIKEFFNLNGSPLSRTSKELSNFFFKVLSNGNIFKQSEFFSLLIQNNCPIQKWKKETILSWAKLLKGYKKMANDCDFLSEMLAVINRAVILHTTVGDCEGYELRKAQVLSILSLLVTQTHKKGKNIFGRLAQISTGEGKSLIISALAVIKALRGGTIDIISSSPLLAKRDAMHFQSFYEMFDIDCADNSGDDYFGVGPKPCYSKKIVYGDTSNFQYDLLAETFSSNLFYLAGNCNEIGVRYGRKFECAIVDEVDNMFIDQESNIAMISYPFPGMSYLETIFVTIWSFVDKAGVTKSRDNEFIPKLKVKIQNKIKKKEIIVPRHLVDFVEHKIDVWIENAIKAKYLYNQGCEYRIVNEEIKLVDCNNTGITCQNTRWENGLHQFLEIKHRLKIHSESLVTNYCTNAAYFKRYENILGLTGTLGSKRAQDFLSNLYGVDFIKIPRYKMQQLKKYPAKVCNTEVNWLGKIKDSTLLELLKDRAVLIICATETAANNVEKIIAKEKLDRFSIKKYTTSDSEHNSVIDDIMKPGEVIIATNLAGRGTDLKISDQVKLNGGLHVCITFLPMNLRVEEQAFGRTAREGKPGTAELIITGESSYEELRKTRDCAEINTLNYDEFTVKVINDIKQNLFDKYCDFRKDLIKEENSLKGNALDKIMSNCFSSTKCSEEDIANNLFKENKWQIKLFYKLKALDEKWGLWLAKQKEFDQDSEDKYIIFVNKIKTEFKDDSILNNPAHLLGYANELIKFFNNWRGKTDVFKYWNDLNKEIIETLKQVIKLDPDLSFYAHYHIVSQNFKIVSKNWTEKGRKLQHADIEEAINHLTESKQLIENIEISRLYKHIELYKQCSLIYKEKDSTLPDKQEEVSKLFMQANETLTVWQNWLNNINDNLKAIKDSIKLIDVIVERVDKWESISGNCVDGVDKWESISDCRVVGGCEQVGVSSNNKQICKLTNIKEVQLRQSSLKGQAASPWSTPCIDKQFSDEMTEKSDKDLNIRYGLNIKQTILFLNELPSDSVVSLQFHNLREIRDMHLYKIRSDFTNVLENVFKEKSSEQIQIDVNFKKISISKAIKLLPQQRIYSIKAEKSTDQRHWILQKAGNSSKKVNILYHTLGNALENWCHDLQGVETIALNLTFSNLIKLPEKLYEEILSKIKVTLTESETLVKVDKKMIIKKVSQVNAIKILNYLKSKEEFSCIEVDLCFTEIVQEGLPKRQAEQIIYLNMKYIKNAIISLKNLPQSHALSLVKKLKIKEETFARPKYFEMEKYLLPATNQDEISEFKINEIRYIFTLSESVPFKTATFAVLFLLIAIQVIGGKVLGSTGIGIPFAAHLVSEGFSDILQLIQIFTGTFSWTTYALIKAAGLGCHIIGESLTALQTANANINATNNVGAITQIGSKFGDDAASSASIWTKILSKLKTSLPSFGSKVLIATCNQVIQNGTQHYLKSIQETKQEKLKAEVEKELFNFLEENKSLLTRIFAKNAMLPSKNISYTLEKELEKVPTTVSKDFQLQVKKILETIDHMYNCEEVLNEKINPNNKYLIRQEIQNIVKFYKEKGFIVSGEFNPYIKQTELTISTTLEKREVEGVIKDICDNLMADYSTEIYEFSKEAIWQLVNNKCNKLSNDKDQLLAALNVACSLVELFSKHNAELFFSANKALLDKHPAFLKHIKILLATKTPKDCIEKVQNIRQKYKFIKTGTKTLVRLGYENLVLSDHIAKIFDLLDYQSKDSEPRVAYQAKNSGDLDYVCKKDLQNQSFILIEQVFSHSEHILVQLTNEDGSIITYLPKIATVILSYFPFVFSNFKIYLSYFTDKSLYIDQKVILKLVKDGTLWESFFKLSTKLSNFFQVLQKFIDLEQLKENGFLDEEGLTLINSAVSNPMMFKKLHFLLANHFFDCEQQDWYEINSLALDLLEKIKSMKKNSEHYFISKKGIFEQRFFLKYYSSTSQQLELNFNIPDHIDPIINNINLIYKIFQSYTKGRMLKALVKFIEFLQLEPKFCNYIAATPHIISNILNILRYFKEFVDVCVDEDVNNDVYVNENEDRDF